MKRLTLLLVAVLVASTTIFANPFKIAKDNPKYKIIEQNLIKGLQSENYGVMYFSAHMLGEMESEAAVNDLLRILRSEKYDESLQIVAALSLTKIATEQSIYMVKQQVKFNDSEKIARLCDKFYKSYVQHKLNPDTAPQVQYAKL